MFKDPVIVNPLLRKRLFEVSNFIVVPPSKLRPFVFCIRKLPEEIISPLTVKVPSLTVKLPPFTVKLPFTVEFPIIVLLIRKLPFTETSRFIVILPLTIALPIVVFPIIVIDPP